MVNRILIISLFFFLAVCSAGGQQEDSEYLNNNDYSDPELLPPPGINSPGFPSRSDDLDVLPGFINPPSGYGEVPFWWWSGDPLVKERLAWQIEQLHQKGITGMQVNYIHRDSPGWPTYPAEPEIFSDRWWDFWKFVSEEAAKRSMGIGMSGYTIDWPKSNNLFNRIIYTIREIQGQELVVDTVIRIPGFKNVSLRLPENTIQAWAYQLNDGKIVPGGKSLSAYIKDNRLDWKSGENEFEIWIYCRKFQPGTINPMHPLSGKTVIDKFFARFEENTKDNTSAGLNYFFQDELKFGVGDRIWTDDFDEVFRKLKGYSVFEVLPGIFGEIGPVTPKARLDFMDVKVRLTEERYFIPIFMWHWNRGMIYGCDPDGRGKEPGRYGDNFRAIRWYTAPGHDTPSGHADFIKGKVSSSIAALYKRPRVWLEGYHSLGWGAAPEQIFYATNENFLYGCNLLNLHGLYYTTHGSFWEWAPPCYHFRMPYWDHMTVFLKYFERLSYLLSQGKLQADIAILYPVSTAQTGFDKDKSVELAFRSGTDLFNNGHDFLFIDDQSVSRSEIADGCMNVSDQSFRILVLPSMRAIRWSTLMKAADFFHSGGIVIATGSLPEASDRAGSNDPVLDNTVRELFGVSANQMLLGEKPSVQIDISGGLSIYIDEKESFPKRISDLLPEYVSSGKPVRYMYRKIGFRDVFMIMGAEKGSWCTFRSEGIPERWDPWTGNVLPLESKKAQDGRIMVKMPLDTTAAQIIVFNTREKYIATNSVSAESNSESTENISVKTLEGEWEFELKPTMDNRWGDFRLPVTENMIGAEARIFRYAAEKENASGWERPDFDDSKWQRVTYGFGQKFWELGPLPANIELTGIEEKLAEIKKSDNPEPVLINGKSYFWAPYSFSWRYGVERDPGHQGYHGLKEEVTDEFICLGKPSPGLNETVYKPENEGSVYYLLTSAYAENVTNVTIDTGGLSPSAIYINGIRIQPGTTRQELKKGSNQILLRYSKAGRGHFVLLADTALPRERTPLSMKWWDMKGRIGFDVRSSEKSPAGWYRFIAPPGLKQLVVRTSGKVSVWIDGKKAVVPASGRKGSSKEINLKEPILHKSLVAIRVEQAKGEYDGSAFPEPVLINCGKGLMSAGDWSEGSVLENYSGGGWYRKTFNLTDEQVKSVVNLDLGSVAATAEIHVNDSLAAILVTSPWKADITRWIRKGENKVEILVFNTLANHYLTIPTKYRGNTLKSGLIGPVVLEFYQSK